MRTVILNQRKERDRLSAYSYQPRQTRYDVAQLLDNKMIKLITGPRRVGKSVFALLMLREKNFAYLNFDDNQLLEKWDEDLVMQLLDETYTSQAGKFCSLQELFGTFEVVLINAWKVSEDLRHHSKQQQRYEYHLHSS